MVWGFFEDVAEAVSDVASDAWNVVEDAAGAAADAIGAAGQYAGDVITTGAAIVDATTGGLAGESLALMDDVIFDPVDYVTGGAIDVDFDDGSFSVDAGIPYVTGVGLNIGENGLATNTWAGTSHVTAGLTDDGLLFNGSAGIDYGPLPHVGAHMEFTPDGQVLIDSELQGTIPTPYGIIAGDFSGGLVRTDQGWGAAIESEGSWQLPSGTTLTGGTDVSYMEDEHGYQLGVEMTARVSGEGIGAVGGSTGYTREVRDGDVVQGVHTDVYAEGFGMRAEAGVGYVHGDVDGVTEDAWVTDVNVAGLSADNLLALGRTLLDDTDVQLPESADGLVGMLGDGDTTQLLDSLMGGGQLDSFMQSLGSSGAAELAGRAVQDGTVGDLVGNMGRDTTAQFVTQAADAGTLGDLVGNLDAEQTAALITTMAAPPVAAQPEPVPVAAQAPPPAVDVVEVPVDVVEPALGEEVIPAPPPVDVVVPEPTEFEQKVAATEQLPDSVDELFEGFS